MISKQYKKQHFCCEDISKVENYYKAITDENDVWHCHHRAEILPCGRYSRDTLKKFGLYYNQPADRLIFLPSEEHRRLHMSGENSPNWGKHLSDEHKKKLSSKNKGKPNLKNRHPASLSTRMKLSKLRKGNQFAKGLHHSEDSKRKIALATKGKKRYNNGEIEILALECPVGFKLGRLPR